MAIKKREGKQNTIGCLPFVIRSSIAFLRVRACLQSGAIYKFILSVVRYQLKIERTNEEEEEESARSYCQIPTIQSTKEKIKMKKNLQIHILKYQIYNKWRETKEPIY